jgi:hypothetical protein
MIPMWVYELADLFWADVGDLPFPRDIRHALVMGSLMVTIKELSHLSIHNIENRLAHLGLPYHCGEADRPLRACLAARGATAWIFLDADDPADEKTGSLVHEVAHLLRQSIQPRRKAIDSLGETILPVIDGKRQPTHGEQLGALLRGVNLDIHVHYLRREADHIPLAERHAEKEADLLAWHLLAPVDEVLARLGEEDDLQRVRALLIDTFGMPATMANDYSEWLCPLPEDSPVVTRLEQAWLARRTSDESRE